jgi:hypothetical protein
MKDIDEKCMFKMLRTTVAGYTEAFKAGAHQNVKNVPEANRLPVEYYVMYIPFCMKPLSCVFPEAAVPPLIGGL